MTNKEALEILDHNWTRLVNSDYTDIELGQAQDLAIKALENERPQGEWVEGYHDYFETLDCSLCGYVRDDRHKTYNFCPNCGAEMRKEEV